MTEYTASTTNNSNTVAATGADGASVTITVNGDSHTSGTSAFWDPGENLVKITAKNGGSQRTYTVTVTKEV